MASLTASLRTSLQRVGRGLAGAPRSAQRVARAFSFDSLSEVLGKSHSEAYQESIRHPESFWGELARKRLRWTRPFVKTLECDFKAGRIRWFEGGSLNVSENCLDRHIERHGNQTALIWEKDKPGEQESVTYNQLLEMTCQLANALKGSGVRKGDCVAIYMPVSPLAAAAMLACARIGAIHSVVFAGFSAESLRERINDSQAATVITADEGVRGGKVIPLKETVDRAVEGLDFVRSVFVMSRTGARVPKTSRDIPLEEAMARESRVCAVEPMGSEDPLFTLYTSGSTGKPKGLVHTQAGYLLYAGLAHQLVFDYRPGDVFACVADIGWITGHSCVVYGPLCNAATSVLFESVPMYPDPGRYWEMVQRLQVTQLYTAPTAIRSLHQHSDQFVKNYDRSSLRVLASVGEPLNTEAWEWYHTVVGEGRCTVVDTWWQTETGGVMISPRPAPEGTPIKPGFPQIPFFGVDPALLDDKGQELLTQEAEGNLCIRSPTPGMARTIHGDHDRFVETYFRPFPGFYFSGDGARRDIDGHYQITGRVDDVINVKGHRVGTAEIESAMDDDWRVAETAVVGYPHELFGQGIYAFVILRDGVEDEEEVITDHLRSLVQERIGSFAVPQQFLITPGLPKTRSGKIMRRMLRKVAAGDVEDLGDTSTLADSSVVQNICAKARQFRKE